MKHTTSPGKLEYVLPVPESVDKSRSMLLRTLPWSGIGLENAVKHLQNDIIPGLNNSSQSPNYYGFVTGGSTPAAAFADNIVTLQDQNLSVHLPKETVATDVEDAALRMVCNLLSLPEDDWQHRTFTTGATASNLIGLACGREYVIQERARRQQKSISVGEDGLFGAMRAADIDSVQVLTTVPHSSLGKAASIVGLGRSSVQDVGRLDQPHRFDLEKLRSKLADPRAVSIVAVSSSEVNTGLFATGAEEMQIIRDLCTEYGAWLHVDAAFGLLARLLPKDRPEYRVLADGVAGLELADSITGDAHKLLNVPYDCGIFLSRHLSIGTQVFQNANAVYLDVGSSNGLARAVPPPLNIGIENSRRFRALPVYATLSAYGRDGYRELLQKQVGLARKIAQFIHQSQEFELLPSSSTSVTAEDRLQSIYIIVLFRARDDKINRELVQRVNGTRKIYISGTKWGGKPASRFAVANWQVDEERDFGLIKEVLLDIVK